MASKKNLSVEFVIRLSTADVDEGNILEAIVMKCQSSATIFTTLKCPYEEFGCKSSMKNLVEVYREQLDGG